MQKPKSMQEVRQKDIDVYLFLENHYRKAGDLAKADDYLRLAKDLMPADKRKARKSPFTSGLLWAPVYGNPEDQTDLQGIAELITHLHNEGKLEVWRARYPNETEEFTWSFLRSEQSTPRVRFSPEERAARRAAKRAARRQARKADRTPRAVMTEEERKAKKLQRRQNKKAYLEELLTLKPKGKKKPEHFNYSKFESTVAGLGEGHCLSFRDLLITAMDQHRMLPPQTKSELKLVIKLYNQDFKGEPHAEPTF